KMTRLHQTVAVVAHVDHDDFFDHMGGWAGGWWLIFPIIMLIFMLLMMSRMFFSRRGSPGRESGTDPMWMGPTGKMGGHGDENRTRDESALDVLRLYAAGELTDEQFDTMRRKLEER
ncbi:MAG: hypothetical protein ACE5MI_14500, partial [Acidimicrobiia bacterium]